MNPAWKAEKHPAPLPKPLRPGQERRVLRRAHNRESQGDAIQRASALGWWARVTASKPAWSAGCWVWTIDPEPAAKAV